VKRAVVALTILIVSITRSQTPQSVQPADHQKLDISATMLNFDKELNLLEGQRLTIQIKRELPETFVFTKEEARQELESVRDLAGSADELSSKLMIGCEYIGGATDQAALEKKMNAQSDIWRNGRVRTWFDSFKDITSTVGAILLASAPILASNGLVDKGYTQAAATVGGIFILVTPVSHLLGSNEDSPAQIVKLAELSRSENDNVYFRQSMINKFRDKANQLRMSLDWAGSQSASLKAAIQLRIDQVNSPAGSVPDPLFQKQNVAPLLDSLVLFLNTYREVAKIIGQSTAELMSTIDQYNRSYPEFKNRFEAEDVLATDLNRNFQVIQEYQLKKMGDITDKLARWKGLVSQ
jgi:hypothetical protein